MSPDSMLQQNIDTALFRWQSECTNYWHELRYGGSEALLEVADKAAERWMKVYYQLVSVKAVWEYEKAAAPKGPGEISSPTWDVYAEDGGEPL